MNQPENVLMACHDCDQLQLAPEVLDAVALIACSRCGSKLRQKQAHSLFLTFACAALGLFLLVIALAAPLASVSMQGRFASSDLLTGPELLWRTGAWELGVIVTLTLLVLPALKLVSVLLMVLALWSERVPGWGKWLFAAQSKLGNWAMVDVFLLGAMIALVRLGAWMPVVFGPALFALGGVALCLFGVDRVLDRQVFWEEVDKTRQTARTAIGARFRNCAGCGLVSGANLDGNCLRCGHRLHLRKPHSVNRTWALIIAATVFAIPANVLPVMTIMQFGEGGPSTIIGGSVELVEHGFWFLATLVFVASVLIPLLKLVSLSALLLCTARKSAWRLLWRTKLYRVVAWIGRWSMLDIFAAMMLVALARFGWVGSVLPGAGASAFCVVVLLTMLASEAFDPRLMWDAAGKNPLLPSDAEASVAL